jgi:hypothetical protein
MRHQEPVLDDEARRQQVEEFAEIERIMQEASDAMLAAKRIPVRLSPADPGLRAMAANAGLSAEQVIARLATGPETQALGITDRMVLEGTRVGLGYRAALAPLRQDAIRVRSVAQQRLQLLQMLSGQRGGVKQDGDAD